MGCDEEVTAHQQGFTEAQVPRQAGSQKPFNDKFDRRLVGAPFYHSAGGSKLE